MNIDIISTSKNIDNIDDLLKLKQDIDNENISPTTIKNTLITFNNICKEFNDIRYHKYKVIYENIMRYVNDIKYSGNIIKSSTIEELLYKKTTNDVLIYIKEFNVYILFKHNVLHRLCLFLTSSRIFKNPEKDDIPDMHKSIHY